MEWDQFVKINGDITKPSTYALNSWISAYDRTGKYKDIKFDYKTIGKWCIVLDKENVDNRWKIIDNAVTESKLWVTAKVSTSFGAALHGGSHVICVYTADWTNKNDVFAIRETLRNLGFTEQLQYKRDIDTLDKSKYGAADEFYYSG